MPTVGAVAEQRDTAGDRRDRAEALLAAPAGAALLARLDAMARAERGVAAWSAPADVDPAALAAAVVAVATTPVEDLLTTAVLAGEYLAGSWMPGAPTEVAKALRLAPRRRPLADAVVARLAEVWAAPLDPDRQVWARSEFPGEPPPSPGPPLGSPRQPSDAWMTATWEGLWTSTAAGDELAGQQASTWEVEAGPITRWRLAPAAGARAYEVTGVDDWAALASDHPLARPRRPNGSWELPNVNQHAAEVAELMAVPGQRAARTTVRNVVEPDWDSVARAWDAVHLTWGGFLLAEGTVIDLGGGDVAMLRGWHSERTLWLTPVLSAAEPLPPIALRDSFVRPTVDAARHARDAAWLAHRLGRPVDPPAAPPESR